MSTSFERNVFVLRLSNAEFFAGDLFQQSFGVPFPVPREHCGLPIPTPPAVWSQYVALYRWPNGLIECIGFCNWIRYGEIYLEGGMCVRPGFYRRLSRDEFIACKKRGGVAEIMMRVAEGELNDGAAWFGYCGDKKAMLVDIRAGYEPTNHKHLIVKWFAELSEQDKIRLIKVAEEVGPF